jgi:hypothetical protein
LNHAGAIVSGHFSPDGTKVLTASVDGTARLWDAESGHAISEPVRHGAKVTAAHFRPHGLQILTCASDRGIRLLDLTPAPLPAPDWLASLAEAVAGQRLDANDVSEAVSVEDLYRLRQERAANMGEDYYDRWGRWFFADSFTRTISPGSTTDVSEYARRRIRENTFESFLEVTRLQQTNALAFARLAQTSLTTSENAARVSPHEAEWFSRYATNLAPQDLQAIFIRQAVMRKVAASVSRQPAN